MKHFLTLLISFLIFIPTVFAEESGSKESPQTGVSQPVSIALVPGIKNQEGQIWGLSMGFHSSYFHMHNNRGEIFRNINLLTEEEHLLFFKPSVQVLFVPYIGFELSYDQFKAAALNRAFDGYPEHDRRWTDGYLKWSPLMFSLQLRWPHLQKDLTPYLLVGMSFTKTSWERSDWYYYGFPSLEVYNQWIGQGQNPEEYPNDGYRRIFATEDHCLGTFMGIGLEYRFYKNWAINLDWRYHWAKVHFTYTLAYDDGQTVISRDGGTFNMDSWILSFGLKYFF